MRVEMLRAKLYRGQHCDPGQIVEMDGETAQWFLQMGWAKTSVEAKPLAPEAADALVPTKVVRRKALR